MAENKWFRIGLANLAIVALYGTIMRYKIAFDLPLFDQKNLLHAHSHFAFSGWISHLLYSGLTLILPATLPFKRLRTYQWLIAANLFYSFGMLVAFTLQGYQFASISFSTASILVAIIFAYGYISDSRLSGSDNASRPWAVAGLLLNAISSFGPFLLGWMLATKNLDHSLYLGSIYYYLHFQYNGWFFFGSVALLPALFPPLSPVIKKHYRLFLVTVVPTFFLSILWAKIPNWLYLFTVLATILQLITWINFLMALLKTIGQQKPNFEPRWLKIVMGGALVALTIKFILQTISVIPSLSQLVFGFRPIVIAYLHLILLGVYTLFLIGWMLSKGLINCTPTFKIAAFVFLAGVILNELILAIQGFAAFLYLPIPYVNEFLFAAAILLFSSAAWMAIMQVKPVNKECEYSPGIKTISTKN